MRTNLLLRSLDDLDLRLTYDCPRSGSVSDRRCCCCEILIGHMPLGRTFGTFKKIIFARDRSGYRCEGKGEKEGAEHVGGEHGFN